MMESNLIEIISTVRTVVGYLGEKDQFGWWQSSFFTQGADAFLAPLFARTQLLAQCNGVTQAAALVHDERIGVGNVYHLFRLPEELEQGIHQILLDTGHKKAFQEMVGRTDTALEYLRENSTAQIQSSMGPTRVGKINSLRDQKTWRISAGLYLSAFEEGHQIFPYFTDI